MYQGYIKDYRRELESDIWQMPPLYYKVWQYLKYKVNHTEYEIPLTSGGKFKIEKGQHLTSYRQIAEGVSYYEKKRKKTPNQKTIKDILEWLEKNHMIFIDHGNGNREYTLITLVNWEVYQCESI